MSTKIGESNIAHLGKNNIAFINSKSSFTSKEIGEHLNSLIEAAKAKGVDLAARRGRGRPAPPMARDID
ncbi:MAG: hypothetical protein SPH43_03510, partial [Candidatus Enteromonas sp.]|nr:hypothetical protein [Candidatus Enteromonas sp.]